MNVNNRAIAIALATVGVVGLAAVPSLGQRAATGSSKDKSAAAARSAAKDLLLNTGRNSISLRRSTSLQTLPGEGGIAGATTSYATNFEAPFATGNVNGQQGWVVFPGTTTGSTITNAGAPQGTQALQLADDAAIVDGNLAGAETPTFGVVGPGRFTVTFTANISAANGADYFVDAISNTDGLVVARTRFFFADSTGANDPDTTPGEILVVDDIGAGLQYVATGVEYTPGTPQTYTMEIDNDANRVKYFQGSTLIYVGEVVSPDSGVEAVDFYSDNFHNPGETGKFDVLSVEAANGLCSADTSKDNQVSINDLLDVINTWGPCAVIPGPNCPADIDGSGATDINDLLEVINNWGPCAVPTGACCAPSSTCSASLYGACITGGGLYFGNGVACGTVTCPGANNECAGASLITLPFSETVTLANYTTNNATDPDTTCEFASGGPFTKDGGWWYRYNVPGSGVSSITVATCNTALDNDTIVSVFTNTCGTAPTTGWTQLGCDDDTCNNPGVSHAAFGASTTTVPVTAGTTVLIFIDNYTGGAFQPTVVVNITANP